jgi:hypothetical protein
VAEAKQSLLNHLADTAANEAAAAAAEARPLTGSGPLGQYTFYEKVAFEFAMRLEKWMTVEKLARPPGTVDSAARQLFASLVKVAGLPSLAAARARGDTTITGFVALRERLRGSLSFEYHQLIVATLHEERIKYGFSHLSLKSMHMYGN